MTKLKLLGAAAVLSMALASPALAQEATQEPGMVGFNYPNSHYLTGGYGVHMPYNSGRYPRMPYGGYVAYDVGPAGVAVGPAPVVVAPGGPGPYGAYAYEPY
ncbi:MAG: hypothetical protein JOZ74_17510 [Bradyrhizobium sp.]|nr:hypothetical protein [Bradyrhizobium sp.]